MTDRSIGRQPGGPPQLELGRPWYYRPEWIIALVAVLSAGVTGAVQVSQGQAQTNQNTQDIRDLKAKVDTMPERLGRIEQKVDDLVSLEKRRRDAAE